MPKGSQNDTTIDAKIKDVSNSSKKNEKYEIKLPLGREHDFTGSGHLKMFEKSIQKTYKINVRKHFAKSMENDTKMVPKWRLRSLENLTIYKKSIAKIDVEV